MKNYSKFTVQKFEIMNFIFINISVTLMKSNGTSRVGFNTHLYIRLIYNTCVKKIAWIEN